MASPAKESSKAREQTNLEHVMACLHRDVRLVCVNNDAAHDLRPARPRWRGDHRARLNEVRVPSPCSQAGLHERGRGRLPRTPRGLGVGGGAGRGRTLRSCDRQGVWYPV